MLKEREFADYVSNCTPQQRGILAKPLGQMAICYKVAGHHAKKTDAAVYVTEDSQRLMTAQESLLKAVNWVNKNVAQITKPFKWDPDDVLKIDQVATEIYTDIVTSEMIMKALKDKADSKE